MSTFNACVIAYFIVGFAVNFIDMAIYEIKHPEYLPDSFPEAVIMAFQFMSVLPFWPITVLELAGVFGDLDELDE